MCVAHRDHPNSKPIHIDKVNENILPGTVAIYFVIYRASLYATHSIRDVVGKAQVYIDVKLVSEKTDSTKNTLTIPILPGEGVRVVSMLIEAPTVGERAGLGGVVTLE